LGRDRETVRLHFKLIHLKEEKLMYDYDTKTQQGLEEINARLLKLINAIEELPEEEHEYNLYCV
jgi:hypothetical protein